MSQPAPSFFASSRLTLIITLVVLFGLGLGIRLFDLTDLPLDFHPTRQLLSVVKGARDVLPEQPRIAGLAKENGDPAVEDQG